MIDIDWFVGEVHGYPSRAPPTATPASCGYHPLLATRAGTGEVLHVRLRKGLGQQRGAAPCASSTS